MTRRRGGESEGDGVAGVVSADETLADQEEIHVSHKMSDIPCINISGQGTDVFDREVPGQVHPKKPSQSATTVGKLGASAYRPFGSDIGSDSTCCRGGPGQIVCGNLVEDGQCWVQCDKCSNWFHASYQVVPSEAVKALGKFPILTWLCSECKPSLTRQSRVSEKITHLEGKVADLDLSLREHMKVVHESLKEQEIAVAQQSHLLKRSFIEQEKVKASYADILKGSCAEAVASARNSASAKLPQPQSSVNIGPQAAKEISGMLDNYMDKDRRKCNVVIYNLPEETGNSQEEKIAKDIHKFREIVKKELRLNLRVTRAFRAGKSLPNRPRLLVATLEDVETKIELLKLAPQLRNSTEWKHLFVNPDLTQKEREEGRKLRKELSRRKSAGETHLYIRQGRIVQGPSQASQTPVGSIQPPTDSRQADATVTTPHHPASSPVEGVHVSPQQAAPASSTPQGQASATTSVPSEGPTNTGQSQTDSGGQQAAVSHDPPSRN